MFFNLNISTWSWKIGDLLIDSIGLILYTGPKDHLTCDYWKVKIVMNHCPECGAKIIDRRDCENSFTQFLDLEFSNPDFGKVHFLTVSCYMIQHGKFSNEGLIWIEQKLQDFFIKNITPEMIRIQSAKDLGQKLRTWKITRSLVQTKQVDVAWSMTITDIIGKFTNAEEYCDQITQWAQATLSDMQPMVEFARKNL